MSFNPALLVKLQPSTLFTDPATIPNVQAATPAVQFWTYNSGTDNLATVTAAGYFHYFGQTRTIDTLLYNNGQLFNVGDIIWAVCSNDSIWLRVTAVTPSVTTTAAINAGDVALTNAHILVGSAGGIATDVAMTGDVTISNTGVTTVANNAIGSTKLALNTIQYAQVAMTAAQWNGMFGAPFQILAAPGANLIYQVDNVWYDMAFVVAQYAAGGVVNLQYDNTVNGAGVPATADTAAATINGLAASSIVIPGLKTGAIAQATTVNKGLFMSNKTGAFTTGDGTWKINVAYRIITA